MHRSVHKFSNQLLYFGMICIVTRTLCGYVFMRVTHRESSRCSLPCAVGYSLLSVGVPVPKSLPLFQFLIVH